MSASTYIDTFLDSNGDLFSFPDAAFTETAESFATEVYRVFRHPRAFDLGSSMAFGDDFYLMAWAGCNFYSEPDRAAIIHRYRNLASLHRDMDRVIQPLSDFESDASARIEANFLEYATEAVADAWSETPLTPEQVADIAEKAMEYAHKNLVNK